MTQLLQKDKKFIGDDKCEASFMELKTTLTIAPIPALHSGTKGFLIYNDASSKGFECVLM